MVRPMVIIIKVSSEGILRKTFADVEFTNVRVILMKSCLGLVN